MNPDPQDLLALARMTNAFLRWPLPESVCVDGCATKQGAGRIGTNLLSFTEARQMFRDVVGPILADKLNRAPVAPAWVKTSERLPVDRQDVWFVYTHHSVTDILNGIYREAHDGLPSHFHNIDAEDVTHWKPWTLQELPKEEATKLPDVIPTVNAAGGARTSTNIPSTPAEQAQYHGSQTHAAEEQRGYNWAGVEAPKPTEPSADTFDPIAWLELLASKWPGGHGLKSDYEKCAALLRSQARELEKAAELLSVETVRGNNNLTRATAAEAKLAAAEAGMRSMEKRLRDFYKANFYMANPQGLISSLAMANEIQSVIAAVKLVSPLAQPATKEGTPV